MRKLVLIAMLAATPAAAFQPTPDWPCIQPIQPHLSLGQVWTGPVPNDAVMALAQTPEITALAARITQRRMTIEDAETEIAAFAQGRDPAALTALMQASLMMIDSHRAKLIEGISRYGHGQVALAARVEQRREKMAALEAAATPDFDAIDAEEKALDMDRRVFADRQQSLTYVCETPVILEQRLFALGRAIASHLPN